ncbi:MAG TPA: YqgE/AlgH family protein [Anaeromyxobacteraceae bacterium]|nr:YqgE/AlgH family protein [Anaeromyxobacteraceae bacterium]
MALRRMVGAGGKAGALALALAVSGPVLGKAATQGRRSTGLGGQLLVARPEMNDPRFSRAVIYMVRHDASGALGLIVNRPFKEIPIAQLLERLGLPNEGVGGSIRMHYGGPVEPGRVFVLHTADWRGEGTQVIADGIALTGPPGILRAIASGKGPRRALLVLSYSGWGPGQLEGEIRAGGWIGVPADPALVFDEDHDTKWARAMARREIDL